MICDDCLRMTSGRCWRHAGTGSFAPLSAAHPSDSERTLRTEAGRALLDVIGELVGHPVADHPEWTRRVLAIESERVSLDAGYWFCPVCSARIAADMAQQIDRHLEVQHALARLSPSTDDQPNQDAGGIPYWPSSDG